MQAIPYILLALSICLETGKNVFSGSFSKNVLKNETDIYKFNFLMYIGSFFILFFFDGFKGSLFSVVLAFIFSCGIWLNQYFFLKALKVGSVSFTNFIQCASLVIPIIFAAIFCSSSTGGSNSSSRTIYQLSAISASPIFFILRQLPASAGNTAAHRMPAHLRGAS